MNEKNPSLKATWVWTLLFIVSVVAFAGVAWGGGLHLYLIIFLIGCPALYVRSFKLALRSIRDRLNQEDDIEFFGLVMQLSIMGIVPVAGIVGVFIGLALEHSERRLLIDVTRRGYGAPLVVLLIVYISTAQIFWLSIFSNSLKTLIN